MEINQSWRLRLSFKNATILLTLFNLITALFFLQSFLFSSPNNRPSSSNQFNSVQLRYIKESEEIRLAMQPWKLIKRVKEIQNENYAEEETVQQKDTKQTAAVDLSKRLKDLRSVNDAANLKAYEEWRKRKVERARLRELEKN
ncbi:uncharacterized protein LOC126666768 [Mercurialis annua]|uniref:uncharacterized protein LOC126666768 n=1 Tax=Mercurialis annua TaxID=3986 RepID=UPI00215F069C|nr:uncharacterized protein LOC126666768 [Mercurialis annua]XP_050215585.1 uncharacterized protein LOC126666768 [Mercurialis annua]XP_050215586.1 uncharacterized protein LOC126666768 [Mercurialis annua]